MTLPKTRKNVGKTFIVDVVIIKVTRFVVFSKKSLFLFFLLQVSHAMPLWYRVFEAFDVTNKRSILIWSPNVDEDMNNNRNLIL